ncbi:MAG: CapA family protein [Clostridia bacterium]|nr:CapA family protein [Clostridia bacterium]
MTTKIVATGDAILFADLPAAYAEKREALDAFLSEGDVRITNLETNVSDFGTFANQYSGGTWHNTRKEAFRALETFGFNFFGTANNHAMDYSYAGLLSTVDLLDEKGYAHAGSGRSLDEAEKPAILNLPGGKTAAIFAVDASMERPSMAGRGSKVFAARPGVNYLRHETVYTVSDDEMADLRRIAEKTSINFLRDEDIRTGYVLPDPEGVFVFGGTTFTTRPGTPVSRCNRKDLRRLCGNIEKAKAENDLVFILVHCHDEEEKNERIPPAYLKEFCRSAIDAGASAVFGGGVHVLRGLEIYRGKPVFYSLGDFIYQGWSVEYLPPDFMEKYGLDVDASAKEALWTRSRGGKIGLMTEEKNLLTVVPQLSSENGELTDLTLMPVKLGFKTGDETLEGLPCYATGDEGEKIFQKYGELSRDLGTELTYQNGLIKIKG